VFDVSFSELFVIALVALLVIGPEKLPKVARTVGAFTGRMQRYMAQIKEEVNREIRFEELQKLQQEIKQSVEREANALQASIHEPSGDAEIKTKTAKPIKITKKVGKPKTTTSKKPSAKKALNDAN
jgi:sec-independent protein translocase protein TatB